MSRRLGGPFPAPFELAAAIWCAVALLWLWSLPIAYPIVDLLGQAALGFSPLLALAGLALAAGALWRRRRGGDSMEIGAPAEIVRAVAAIAATAAFHFLLKASIPVINSHNWDNFLWEADQALHFGLSPSLFLVELLRDTGAYRFFDVLYTQLYYVAVMGQAGVLLGAGNGRDRRIFATAYVLLWIAGIVLYVTLPSWGPAFTRTAEFSEPLAHMPATVAVQSQLYQETLALVRDPLAERLVRYGGLAAFPSLHIAILWLFTLASRRLSERWFHANILLVLAMLAGSVVTGYHYLIDGYAGFLLGWLVFVIARRWVTAWEAVLAAPQPEGSSNDG